MQSSETAVQMAVYGRGKQGSFAVFPSPRYKRLYMKLLGDINKNTDGIGKL